MNKFKNIFILDNNLRLLFSDGLIHIKFSKVQNISKDRRPKLISAGDDGW